MNNIGAQVTAGITAIIGLAVLAVVVSNAANTSNVVKAFFGGLSNLIGVAISPITGQAVNAGTGLSGGSWAGGSVNSGFSLTGPTDGGSDGYFGQFIKGLQGN